MGIYGTKERCRRVLVGRLKGKRPLGRPEYRWEENIKMIFKMADGWAWTGVIWFRKGQVVALGNAVMNLWVP